MASPESASETLVEIRHLSVAYRGERGWREALRDVSLTLHRGEVYGLVGESGSGKTTLALALMGYLPEGGVIREGSLRFAGQELRNMPQAAWRRIRGDRMALVPQNPLSALNPSLKVGEQVAEVIRHHRGADRQDARRSVLELFESVRLTDPERVYDLYPHHLSGGMQQRVMIAMALSGGPELLVLDEPTTNLDATTQAAILDLLCDLMRAHGTAALYVTHNLGVVAQICDRVAVLYAGELVEDADTRPLYHHPLHPYTRGLLDSVPRLGSNKREVTLRYIEGRIPSLDALPSGCVFRTRCPLAIDICKDHPPLYDGPQRASVRCHRWQEIDRGEVDAAQPAAIEVQHGARAEGALAALSIRDLRVHFQRQGRTRGLPRGPKGKVVRAVDGITLRAEQGKTLGLVGESGSGKTTLARAVAGLLAPTTGDIRLDGQPLPPRLSQRTIELLRKLQMVFQNPNEAFNPYMTIGASLQRPYRRLLGYDRKRAQREVNELLEAVQLSPSYAARLPAELSGGEKQRAAIARAFAARPALLIADEAVSALDVSVQASVLNVLNALQRETGSASLFISHDLAVVGYLSDVVAVVYLGQLMEIGDADQIFDPPYHPYTEALLSAIPLIDPDAQQERVRLEGEIPSPTEVIAGCPFYSRCPRFLGRICVDEKPPWRETAEGKHIYCHIPVDELISAQDRIFSFSGEG